MIFSCWNIDLCVTFNSSVACVDGIWFCMLVGDICSHLPAHSAQGIIAHASNLQRVKVSWASCAVVFWLYLTNRHLQPLVRCVLLHFAPGISISCFWVIWNRLRCRSMLNFWCWKLVDAQLIFWLFSKLDFLGILNHNLKMSSNNGFLLGTTLGILGSCQLFIVLFVNGRQLNGHEWPVSDN